MKIKGISKAMVIIEGASPLLMHNGQLANPLNPIVKQMKEITSKHHSKKTEADLLELMRLEFMGGLYFDDKIGPYIPCEAIEGTIRAGATLKSKGKQVVAGVQVDPAKVKLIYNGPKSADKLYEDKNFVDVRGVGLNKSATIMRTRPRFDSWSAEFELMVIDEVLSLNDVRGFIEKAGMLKGILDYRPKFGRFILKEFIEV